MTHKICIRQRTTEGIAFLVIFFVLGICSCFAQGPKTSDVIRDGKVRNAGRDVNFADVNVNAEAIPVHGIINGPYAELKPTLTPKGTRLYFSRSLHPLNTGGEGDQEDIWYAEFDKTTDTWSEPVRLPGTLNNAGPNFINSVSMTGDTIILGNQYTKKGKMRAGLSYSIVNKGQWSAPLPIFIERDYNISDQGHAYVSLKSGIIISAIERVETYGGRDLYVSFWDGLKGTEPINMGGVINSALEESSPYLASDQKTLYFASKGHLGMGGYDIYVSHRLDDSWTNWSEPQNMGPAVNGPMDDEFFSITHCGKFAIFSKQVSVHNTDLFKISIQDLMFESQPEDMRREQPMHDETAIAKL
jgi:hypothetical protein